VYVRLFQNLAIKMMVNPPRLRLGRGRPRPDRLRQKTVRCLALTVPEFAPDLQALRRQHGIETDQIQLRDAGVRQVGVLSPTNRKPPLSSYDLYF
jgi:hypothetical protein